MPQLHFDVRPPALTVSVVNSYIRDLFEQDELMRDLRVEGEISNWSPARSGHIYFTLKDATASIKCVIWRSAAQRLRYRPQRDGEAVIAHGRVSVYEAGGAYQLYVDDLEPAGQGALYQEFERLKHQLAAEGLFDDDQKRALPSFPQRIGVVTSSDAAALRDILNVLGRRYPIAQVVLSPTAVQGKDAPLQIVAALAQLYDLTPAVDVILVARGGGSIEDLWAFNDEMVARAIAASPVPLISGVGHETDFTIADFVADHRAPTPSAAAEVAVPDAAELRRLIAGYQFQFTTLTAQWLDDWRDDVQEVLWRLQRLSPQAQINNRRQSIDDRLNRLQRSLLHGIRLQREQLNAAQARLAALNPKATLARGYAIVQKNEQLITQRHDVSATDTVTVTLADGKFDAVVQ